MSESHHQCALVQWWNTIGHKKHGIPKEALFAVPNGGARTAITGARLKREGVRKGVFDILLMVCRKSSNGLWIEMKHGKNKLTPEQEQFSLMASAAGYECVVCWNWEEAKKEIEGYLT